MKIRSWLKMLSGGIVVAVTTLMLVVSSSSAGENAKQSWTVKQGQEITIGNNLKLVVVRVAGGEAEIAVSPSSEASVFPVSQKKDNDPPSKDPCPCSCPSPTPTPRPRPCKNNADCD